MAGPARRAFARLRWRRAETGASLPGLASDGDGSGCCCSATDFLRRTLAAEDLVALSCTPAVSATAAALLVTRFISVLGLRASGAATALCPTSAELLPGSAPDAGTLCCSFLGAAGGFAATLRLLARLPLMSRPGSATSGQLRRTQLRL